MESEPNQEFKIKVEHYNKLLNMVKFIDKQHKNIHIYIKNIIQTNDPQLINDTNAGININISELSTTSFDKIQKYIEHIKNQNIILDGGY